MGPGPVGPQARVFSNVEREEKTLPATGGGGSSKGGGAGGYPRGREGSQPHGHPARAGTNGRVTRRRPNHTCGPHDRWTPARGPGEFAVLRDTLGARRHGCVRLEFGDTEETEDLPHDIPFMFHSSTYTRLWNTIRTEQMQCRCNIEPQRILS